MAPVGIGPAGARPVLGAPEPDGVCEGAADPDPEAADPVCVTIATGCRLYRLANSALGMTEVVVFPLTSVSSATRSPSILPVQVMSASVIAPCHLHSMLTVQRFGVGSVKPNDHVDAPCFKVYGSQKSCSKSPDSSEGFPSRVREEDADAA